MDKIQQAIATIRALEGYNGHLHIVLDDENYEDNDLQYCEQLRLSNDGEMSKSQLALEMMCIDALWLLSAEERQEANELYDAKELEQFYLQHPAR